MIRDLSHFLYYPFSCSIPFLILIENHRSTVQTPGQNLSQCYQPDLFRKSTENSNGTIDEDTASESSKVSPFQPSFFIRFVLRAYSWPRLRRWKFNGAFNGYSVGARLGRKRLKEEKTARLSPSPPEFCPIARSARASTCVPSPSDRKGFYRYEFNFRTNSQPPPTTRRAEPSRAEQTPRTEREST